MSELRDYTQSLQHNRALGECGDYMILRANGQPVPAHLARFHAKAATGSSTSESLQPDLYPVVSLVEARSVLGRLNLPTAPIHAKLPVLDDAPEAYWTGENVPIPIVKITFSDTQLEPTKIAMEFGLSREVLKAGEAKSRNLVLRMATRRMVLVEDRVFLGTAAADVNQPAGILNGVTSSGVVTLPTLADDLAQLFADVSEGDPIRPVYVTSGRGALWLQKSGAEAFADANHGGGGTVGGAPLLISAAAGNKVILIDADAVVAYDGGLEIDASPNASVMFSDTPTSPASLTSAWQCNLAVLRLLRFVNWTKLRDDATAFLELPIDASPA